MTRPEPERRNAVCAESAEQVVAAAPSWDDIPEIRDRIVAILQTGHSAF